MSVGPGLDDGAGVGAEADRTAINAGDATGAGVGSGAGIGDAVGVLSGAWATTFGLDVGEGLAA